MNYEAAEAERRQVNRLQRDSDLRQERAHLDRVRQSLEKDQMSAAK